MIINETIKKKKTNTILNEENYSVYKRRADQDLFLYACSLTPRNSFYHSEVERLNYLVDLIQKNDSKFIEALTYYLGKILGIRLSPAIIIAELALRDDVNWKAIEKIVRDVFTRPDFIANTLGYIKYKFQTKSFLDRTPYEFSKILKSQLESFNELTLKRRKMKRKAIKLADLIKTLRPRPKDEKMSRLYKAIIENDNYASLKTEIIAENKKIKSSEHITAAISSSEVSYAEKKKFVQDNIEKIPINALIKNLSFLETKDIGILEKRLVDIFESGNGLRFINPFDLIMLNNIDFQRYSNGVEDRVDSDIIHVLDKILSKYVHINVYAQNPLILYDCSGSMDGNPHRIGIKFISAFQKIFRKDFRFYKFDYDVENITNDVKRIFIDSSGANEFARKLMRSMHCDNGTALLESMKKVLQDYPEADLFIIVTDEVTWADPDNINLYKRILPDKLLGKTILFNASPETGSVFKPSVDITRLAGLSGRILSIIKAIADFDTFKIEIINEFQQ